MTDIEILTRLYYERFAVEPDLIKPIAGAGSDRRYFIIEGEGNRVVGTVGTDLRENRAFLYLARQIGRQLPGAVPEILAESPDGMAYLQSFAGEMSLFDLMASARNSGIYSVNDEEMLGEAMRLLARIQIQGARGMDFDLCYPEAAMNANMVRWDLNYFKYCFAKPRHLAIDEPALQADFDSMERILLDDECHWCTFMYRDFQSRNVMVSADRHLTGIDFQGGRRGPVEYDVASFVWQAKAAYPESLKTRLTDIYLGEAVRIDPTFDVADFRLRLPAFVLFRVMQTLGAYGFRGTVEHKPHFLRSLDAGIRNLYNVVTAEFPQLKVEFPIIYGLASQAYASLPDKEKLEGVNTESPLTVTVMSFSYKKDGYPTDDSGNGGGFIFDCRAVHNPGRYEQYKPLTGMDAPVREFLESNGEIFPFLDNAFALVDRAVEKYVSRGFSSLQVGFGCTGGRHRSVYSANAMAEHLRAKYPQVHVRELHLQQPHLNR